MHIRTYIHSYGCRFVCIYSGVYKLLWQWQSVNVLRMIIIFKSSPVVNAVDNAYGGVCFLSFCICFWISYSFEPQPVAAIESIHLFVYVRFFQFAAPVYQRDTTWTPSAFIEIFAYVYFAFFPYPCPLHLFHIFCKQSSIV